MSQLWRATSNYLFSLQSRTYYFFLFFFFCFVLKVSLKHLKGGKDKKMDVLVMENILFRRNFIRLYDLKGSSRSRYNPDTSGINKVLLDQNLIEAMPTSPIFVGNKAKRLLERAVWNDTAFLAVSCICCHSLFSCFEHVESWCPSVVSGFPAWLLFLFFFCFDYDARREDLFVCK